MFCVETPVCEFNITREGRQNNSILWKARCQAPRSTQLLCMTTFVGVTQTPCCLFVPIQFPNRILSVLLPTVKNTSSFPLYISFTILFELCNKSMGLTFGSHSQLHFNWQTFYPGQPSYAKITWSLPFWPKRPSDAKLQGNTTQRDITSN